MVETGSKILILGGTKEAAELADRLVREGSQVIYSLAGRTSDPLLPKAQLRVGGFGGASGLAEYLTANAVDLLVDATHPFARQISANAREASRLSGIPLDVVTRKPWEPGEGDKWIEVESLEAARAALPEGATVFLALGSQHIDAYRTCTNVRFIVRMVDPPTAPLPFADHELVLARPSEDWREERDLLEAHAVTHIVCRNSGGDGAYAKIRAARELGLPVIMINRP